jgi:formate hydrogenlyase subunit 6/NADH:ubiquinone oxidoreductase subunit I
VGDATILDPLFGALRNNGYRLIGPTTRDGAIVYDELITPADLPVGWTDVQTGGHYRLKRREDAANFGYVVGPHSWKSHLFPPKVRLYSVTRDGLDILPETHEVEKRAFIGVRSCELEAISIQDRVFMGSGFQDPAYRARKSNLFIVAINCTEPGGTCFCASMDTGPQARGGYDLALTEIIADGRHEFLIDAATEAGRRVLEHVPCRSATAEQAAEVDALMNAARQRMGRAIDTTHVHERLSARPQHSNWDAVAERCLACANCTMVCPTCFCSTVEDTTDLTGDHAERWRYWDSCFTSDFSYIHGGSVRSSIKSRYRQWLTHKFASWHDQFGTSGCVGCGRCITWCPVGIDVTAEVAAICRDDDAKEMDADAQS